MTNGQRTFWVMLLGIGLMAAIAYSQPTLAPVTNTSISELLVPAAPPATNRPASYHFTLAWDIASATGYVVQASYTGETWFDVGATTTNRYGVSNLNPSTMPKLRVLAKTYGGIASSAAWLPERYDKLSCYYESSNLVIWKPAIGDTFTNLPKLGFYKSAITNWDNYSWALRRD